MRVVLLNQFFPPDVAATGQLLGDLADALAQRGHEVHVLCSRRAYGGGGEVFPAESKRNGVFVHRVAATGFGRAGAAGRVADYLSFYVLAGRRAMALPKMDVCVSLTTPPFLSLLGRLLRRRRKTRLVLWTMDLYPEIAVTFGVLRAQGRLHRLLAALARRVYRSADAIVSLGEVMAQRLRAAGAPGRAIHVVHNWVPREAVNETPPSEEDRVTLLYSGNLGLGHELETILYAAAKLPEAERSRLGVRFIGYGKLRPRLEALTEELGLTCVEFAPPCPLGELSESLSQGDVHLISQRPGTEGLLVPSKLYGILAAGRPALYVGSDQTEVAEILRDALAGRIVPAGDVSAAAKALRDFIRDADLRRDMGRRARTYYQAHFGRDRSTARLVDVIESTLFPPKEGQT